MLANTAAPCSSVLANSTVSQVKAKMPALLVSSALQFLSWLGKTPACTTKHFKHFWSLSSSVVNIYSYQNSSVLFLFHYYMWTYLYLPLFPCLTKHKEKCKQKALHYSPMIYCGFYIALIFQSPVTEIKPVWMANGSHSLQISALLTRYSFVQTLSSPWILHCQMVVGTPHILELLWGLPENFSIKNRKHI